MKAYIQNSQLGIETKIESESILNRQLKQLLEFEIKDVIIDQDSLEYCRSLDLPMNFLIDYDSNEDILKIQGNLVFENALLDEILRYPGTCEIPNCIQKIFRTSGKSKYLVRYAHD